MLNRNNFKILNKSQCSEKKLSESQRKRENDYLSAKEKFISINNYHSGIVCRGCAFLS